MIVRVVQHVYVFRVNIRELVVLGLMKDFVVVDYFILRKRKRLVLSKFV